MITTDICPSCVSRSAKVGFWDPSCVICGHLVTFCVVLLLSCILWLSPLTGNIKSLHISSYKKKFYCAYVNSLILSLCKCLLSVSVEELQLNLLLIQLNAVRILHEPFNPWNPELNPICYLLALLGAHHFLHVSRIRVKFLTFRLLMSYIWSTHSWCF